MQRQLDQCWNGLSPFVSKLLVLLFSRAVMGRFGLVCLTIVGLVSGIAGASALTDHPLAVEGQSTTRTVPGITVPTAKAASEEPIPVTKRFPQEGVYLYGQSAEPDQRGQAYLVFEVKGDRVVGAFYMPSSSFDCFYGGIQANKLALTVIDSYERTHHPYEITLVTKDPIAGTNLAVTALDLDGYIPLKLLTENDQRILKTCKDHNSLQV